MIEVYVDAHGTRERDVKHHMLLPHEIFESLYNHGLLVPLLCPDGPAGVAYLIHSFGFKYLYIYIYL